MSGKPPGPKHGIPEVLAGAIRLYASPHPDPHEPFIGTLAFVADHGVATLKALSPGVAVTEDLFRAIEAALAQLGMHTAVWYRFTLQPDGSYKRREKRFPVRPAPPRS